MTNILGINSAYHEDSAALITKDGLVACVEQERFNRAKHAKYAQINNSDVLPYEAIDFCLERGHIHFEELDWIGYTFQPYKRLQDTIQLKTPYSLPEGDWGSLCGELTFYRHNMGVIDRLFERYGCQIAEKFVFLSHHECHAASAFYPSPFEKAAVLVVDGIGESETCWLGYGERHEVTKLQGIDYPHSLGLAWERLVEFVGFHPYNAAYLMGLAAYGKSDRFVEKVEALIPTTPNGLFEVNLELLRFREEDNGQIEGRKAHPRFLNALAEHFQVPPRDANGEYTAAYCDIAYAAQKVIESRLLQLVHHLYEQYPSDNLCLAGGVALNCVANERLLREGPYKHLWVQPASNDAGTSLGATLLIHHQFLQAPRDIVMEHAYWGPDFSVETIERSLKMHGLVYTCPDDICKQAAALIAEGLVVSWFQGRMEFGPRALGNRSLLADPRRRDMREILNKRVKHRAWFRPFCPSVLAEEAANWFEIPDHEEGYVSRFMLMACPVVPTCRELVPAITHVDGTSRVQTVLQSVNPMYWSLIRAFYDLTGVPMVLNTSFNDSEPIVCNPDDAIQTFLKTEIDCLAIGPFLVCK